MKIRRVELVFSGELMNVTAANLRYWIEGTEKGDMDAEDKLIDWSLYGCCLFFFRAPGVLAKSRLVEPIVKPEYVGLYLWEIMGSTTMPVPYPTKNEN
jgi:hypothetical protein